MNEYTPEIITKAAEQAGLDVKQLTPDSPAFLLSSQEKETSFIAAPWCIYPNQMHWQAGIMRYKELSSLYLDNGRFTSVPGKFYYSTEYTAQELEKELLGYIDQELGFPCVIKPNNGSHSRYIHIVTDPKHLNSIIPEIQKNIPQLLVQKYLNQDEYRIFIYQGEIQFLYKKKFIAESENVNRTEDSPCEKEYMMKEQFPAYLSDFTKKLYQYTQTEIIGVDVFLEKEISQEQNITILELNHNPGLAVMYQTYNEKKIIIDLLSSIYKKYLD